MSWVQLVDSRKETDSFVAIGAGLAIPRMLMPFTAMNCLACPGYAAKVDLYSVQAAVNSHRRLNLVVFQ